MAQITGKVKEVLEVRSGMKKNGEKWYMQDYVLSYTKNNYEKFFLFTLGKADKINEFAPLLKVGNEVTVLYDVEARSYNGKWYNSVTAWKVESPDGTAKRDRSLEEAAIPAPQESSLSGDQMPF